MANQRVSFNDVLSFSRASTATYFDSSGVLQTAAIDEPRRNHDPVTGEPLGVLIEPSRTNLLLWSEDFFGWRSIRASVTTNDTESPDGSQSADKLFENTQTGEHNARTDIPLVDGGIYSTYIFAKASERSVIQFVAALAFENGYQNFDLQSGTLADGTLESEILPLGNGWYRCAVNNLLSSGTSGRVQWNMVTSPSSPRIEAYTGDGTSGIFIWGAQLEQVSFPTSYIPTAGAPVTRAADIITTRGDA